MRRRYLKPKYRAHAASVARKAEIRRLKMIARLRHVRMGKQRKKRVNRKQADLANGLRTTTVRIQRRFTLIDSPEEAIATLSRLEKLLNEQRPVFVDMTAVEDIDYPAISALLAIMYVFKSEGIPFNGNFPAKMATADTLRGSGFIYQLFENKSDKVKYSINEDNQMLTQVDKKLDPTLLTTVIEDVSKTVWGEPRRSQGLNRVILEMIDNTHDHAAGMKKGTERWWLSINKDPSNQKVSFVFLDYGLGIFNTLAQKPNSSALGRFMEAQRQKWGLNATDEYLKAIMTTQLRNTSSDKKGRGHGLYGIADTVRRNQISNLHVFSNDAVGDIKNARYLKLNQGFSGTLFYWELSYTNHNSPWLKNT